MKTETLVEKLDELDHNERLRQLIEYTRGLDSEPRNVLLRDLQGGDTHQRWLGIQAAGHSGEFTWIWKGLQDSSVMVRASSAAFVGRAGKEIPVSILDDVDLASLRVMYGYLMRRQASAISEPLTLVLISHDRLSEAAALLCSCSDEFILARLKSVAWPEQTWEKIAKHRPHLLVDKIETEFSTSDRPEVIWQRYGTGVWGLLSDSTPQTVCDWVDRFSDVDKLPHQLVRNLAALLRHDVNRVIGWLAERVAWFSTQRFPNVLTRMARQANPTALRELSDGLIFVAPDKFAMLISSLPYPLRASLFEGAISQLETSNTEWSIELLRVLPRHLRDREALRMLGLPRAKTDGWWRRLLLGMCDIDSAREALQVEASSAQAEERGEAHAALVRSTFGSGKGFEETFARLARTKNEQDPVRSAFLAALAEVPGHYFQDTGALDAVISPSFEARDLSYQSRASILRIARRLMSAGATSPNGPMFLYAITLLERLAGHQGTPDFPPLYSGLPQGAERPIYVALKPWMEAAKSRQQAAHVFALWRALGERAWRIPEFGDLIGDMIWSGNKNHAAAAARHWLEDPKTRDKRASELVAKDASALYLNEVLQHAHLRRQTWLNQRFKSPSTRGRFHDGKVVYIPHFSSGFWRWPTALQRRYVGLIRQAEADSSQYSASRASLVSLRARVPVTRVEDFAKELESKDVVIQEAALGAIVWTDEPEAALPILLQNLDGDRARVAMYAMPRLARLTRRAEFVGELSGLLGAAHLKVTVHKEVLRLLGQAGTVEAVGLIHREWKKDLHRDVRIAAIHAARSLLSRDEAWEILTEGATSELACVAKAVAQVPTATVASRYRKPYLNLMVSSADHQDPEVRAAFFAALGAGWQFVDLPLSVEVAARILTRMDSLDPWRGALRVAVAAGRSSAEHPQVMSLIEELVLVAQDATPAGTRDQMAHQRLVALLNALRIDRHPNSLALMNQAAHFLCEDRDWWWAGAMLGASGAENSDLASAIVALVRSAPSALSVRYIIEAAALAAEAPTRAWSSEQAQNIVEALCVAPGFSRVVAVSMVSVFGRKFGWGEWWVERIEALRNDDDVDVRTAARSVWIALA